MNTIKESKTGNRIVAASGKPRLAAKHRRARIASIAGITFILLAALFLITGYAANVSYTGSVSRVIHAPASEVWSLLNDTQRFSKNRHQVKSMEMLPADEHGMRQWVEHTSLAGDMRFVVTQQIPEQLLVTKMVKSDFGMSGTWEFKLIPEGNNTRVVITERSLAEGLIMRSILNTLGRSANMWLLQNAIEKGVRKS